MICLKYTIIEINQAKCKYGIASQSSSMLIPLVNAYESVESAILYRVKVSKFNIGRVIYLGCPDKFGVRLETEINLDHPGQIR